MTGSEACPNCSMRGYFDGVRCVDCGYGRNRNSIVLSAADKEQKEKITRERKEKFELIRCQLKDHPISKNWPGNRHNNIADLCVTLGLGSAQEWFVRGPYVPHITGYDPKKSQG